MFIYLLKMIACSAAFYGLYMLLFRNEKMLVFNRFYLLLSLIISFTIPLITFTVYTSNDVIYRAGSVKESHNGIDDAMMALAIIGLLGSLLLLVRFIKNLIKLKKRMGATKRFVNFRGTRVVLLDEPVVPHSFLNTIFLNNEEYQGRCIEAEVLEHEWAHVKQKHSWDILFIELLQIFCWFNPLIYLYKQSIKINHELLADAAVVKELDNMRSYQHILLQRAGAQASLALASSFHFFITKKRIIMLQKKVNPVSAGLKAMLCLPLLVLLVFIFGERVYAQAPPPPPPPSPGKVSKNKPSNVDVITVKTEKGRDSRAIVKYKNGKEVSADVSTREKRDAFEKEHGVKLPPPPPPPPPATRKGKKEMPPPPPPPVPATTDFNEPPPPPPPPPATRKNKKVMPPPPPPVKAVKEPVAAVAPVDRLQEHMIAHALQVVEAYYTANASTKVSPNWGIDNLIKTKLNF